jgi:hypothetical protein
MNILSYIVKVNMPLRIHDNYNSDDYIIIFMCPLFQPIEHRGVIFFHWKTLFQQYQQTH